MASHFCCRLAAAFVVLLGSGSVFAAAAGSGDLWQVNSKMAMDGVPPEMLAQMPGQTMQVCAARVWTQPPGGPNQHNCARKDFQMHGNTATWLETCENPTMTGQGEITRDGEDAYTGSIRFASADGNMTINLDGKRVGVCDNPQ